MKYLAQTQYSGIASLAANFSEGADLVGICICLALPRGPLMVERSEHSSNSIWRGRGASITPLAEPCPVRNGPYGWEKKEPPGLETRRRLNDIGCDLPEHASTDLDHASAASISLRQSVGDDAGGGGIVKRQTGFVRVEDIEDVHCV